MLLAEFLNDMGCCTITVVLQLQERPPVVVLATSFIKHLTLTESNAARCKRTIKRPMFVLHNPIIVNNSAIWLGINKLCWVSLHILKMNVRRVVDIQHGVSKGVRPECRP